MLLSWICLSQCLRGLPPNRIHHKRFSRSPIPDHPLDELPASPKERARQVDQDLVNHCRLGDHVRPGGQNSMAAPCLARASHYASPGM